MVYFNSQKMKCDERVNGMVNLGNDWDEILADEFQKDYYIKLREFLKSQYSTHEVYPPMGDIFNALKYSSYGETKVVILGQDPYHQPGQAHGLCFSVNKGVKIPPSLVNIYKEMKEDLGIGQPPHGYLADWARQGVLLLNATLTVRRGEPNSHRGRGWEVFTDRIIELLNERQKPMVFVLWGANARAKSDYQHIASHSDRSPSEPAVGIQRIFRRGIFQQSQPFS